MGDLLFFILLNLLGVMSPGPDFAIVTRYGLTGSRKRALLASLGVGVALLVHVFYCVSGVALFLHSSPKILHTIQIIGALYLGYLGIKLLFAQAKELDSEKEGFLEKGAFFNGFFTNLLNPKATLFLLSLFSQFSGSMTTVGMKISFGFSIPLVALSWFALLSYIMTHPAFLPFMQREQGKFYKGMGILLLLLSISSIVSVLIA